MEPVYTSEATRCPRGESGIVFIWDVRTGAMRARVSPQSVQTFPSDPGASLWCDNFNLRQKRFNSLREASRYVEQYDTWFHTA